MPVGAGWGGELEDGGRGDDHRQAVGDEGVGSAATKQTKPNHRH